MPPLVLMSTPVVAVGTNENKARAAELGVPLQGMEIVDPAASNLQRDYPFSTLHGSANVLIFPDLDGAITQSILEQRVVSVEARGHAHTLAILTRHFPKIVLDCI